MIYCNSNTNKIGAKKMMNYVDITAWAVLVFVFSIVIGLILTYCREALASVINCDPFGGSVSPAVVLGISLLMVGCGLLSLRDYIFDSPVSIARISELSLKCPGTHHMITSRAEILKWREAVSIYSQCLKDNDLAEQVTLEKQKDVVREIGKNKGR